MKIALVHELLTMKGGAERVLRIAADLFPQAPIYTLLYDERKMSDWFPRERVQTSTLQRRANALNHFPLSPFHFPFNHHLYLKHFPAAVEQWDFSGFDLVLSFSSAFAHGIITNSAPRHLCYVHSPARYLWDRTHDVLERAGRGMLGPLRKSHLSRTFHPLRIWDSEAADRPDALIAASREVQRRIELYWRRESEVIYPPIDDGWLNSQLTTTNSQNPIVNCELKTGSYYLVVSQLASYKRLDLAIRACNQRKAKLIIAGDGPAKRALASIAGPTIEFAGYQTDDELKTLYANARAVLFPGEEDFGLVPLESLACGTPVIAFRGGGALETLNDGTAEFFDDPTPESLVSAMDRAEKKTWNADACRARAREFSRGNFEKKLKAAVERMLETQPVQTATTVSNRI